MVPRVTGLPARIRSSARTTRSRGRKKLEAALSAGLEPILCIGETIDEAAKRAYEAAAKIDFETVIPGHGSVMKRADFDKWRKSMDSVLAEVTKLKKAGKSKEEVASTLKLEDHGWASGRFFMQRSLPGLYDEIK